VTPRAGSGAGFGVATLPPWVPAPAPHAVKLVCPYVEGMLWPQTRAIGERFNAQFANVGGSDTAYHALLTRLWAMGEGFALLEHDLSPSDALLSELLACEQPWCSGAYLYRAEGRTILIWGQGIVKFSTRLVRAESNAMAFAPCHWEVLDLVLADVLTERGYVVHQHLPAVRHLRLDMAVTVIKDGVRYETPGRGEPPLVFQSRSEVSLLGRVLARLRRSRTRSPRPPIPMMCSSI